MVGDQILELADRAARKVAMPYEDHYEDIRQEAAMKILELDRQGVTFDTESGWVIAGRNGAIDWLRSEQSRTRDTDQEPPDYAFGEWLEAHEPNPERRCLSAESFAELCRWLRKHRPRRLEALLLTGMGYTAPEVAEQTGYSPNAVHTLVHRTRREVAA